MNRKKVISWVITLVLVAGIVYAGKVVVDRLAALSLVETGEKYVQKKEYVKAYEAFVKAYRRWPEKKIKERVDTFEKYYHSALAFEEGEKLLRKRAYREALQAFQKVIPEDPRYDEAQEKIKNLYEIIEKEELLARSREHYEAGVAAYNRGEFDLALSHLTEVLPDDPNYPNAQRLIEKIAAIVAERKRVAATIREQKREEENIAIVPPREQLPVPPRSAPRQVEVLVQLKPYDYQQGNYRFVNRENGVINVEVRLLNTETATIETIYTGRLYPGMSPPQIRVRGRSDYRLKIYYNKTLVEAHDLEFYTR